MESLRSFTSSTLSNWSFPSYDEHLHSLADLKEPERFKLPIEGELYLRLHQPILPDIDRSHSTRLACLSGLGATWLAILVCIVGFILIIVTQEGSYVYKTTLSTASARALSFIMNIFLTFSADVLGYIHGISLRWALFREGRLDFNSNTRFFNSTRRSLKNRWPSNLLGISSLVLSYAATSQIFINGTRRTQSDPELLEDRIFVNGIAIFGLGLGLFGQAVIATWCIFEDARSIPTWGSNPLTNTLASMHEGLLHRPGRCMISVHESRIGYSREIQPSTRQGSAKSATRSVLYVIVFVWISAFLIFIWTLSLVLSCRNSVLQAGKQFRFSTSWTTVWSSPTELAKNQTISVNVHLPHYLSFVSKIVFGILFTCAIQATQTISLHCLELLINISRDEKAWRQAHVHNKGAVLASNGFISAATSFPNLVLFFTKAALHWLLGQCLMASFTSLPDSQGSYEFDMIYMRVFIYGCSVTGLAIFASYLGMRRPRGPQPAAWGHYQTLADLIDNWSVDPAGRFWWGDKGSNGLRHAGTSMRRDELGDIMMDAVYAGSTVT